MKYVFTSMYLVFLLDYVIEANTNRHFYQLGIVHNTNCKYIAGSMNYDDLNI